MNTQFRLAWRYLRGRGLRSLLTTLAVIFGVMLIFGLNGVTPTLMQAFSRNLLATAGKIDLSVSSSFNEPFGLDVLNTVARVKGVAAATPEIQRTVIIPSDPSVPAADQVSQLNVIGIDPTSAGKVRDFPLSSGRALAAGDDNALVLDSDLAKQLGVALGGTLTLPSSVGSTRFTVVGLLSTPTTPGEEQVFVPLSAAQALFAYGRQVNVVEAAFAQGVDRTATESAVRTALGPDYTVGGLSTNSSLLAALQVSQIAFQMFGLFALATGAFIILNSFRTLVSERRRDVGMLRAIGAKRRTIIGMFLIESVLQGIVGTAIGIVAGWAMAGGLFALLGGVFDSVLHTKLPGLTFDPAALWEAIVLGIGVTVASALIPARAAGRVTPMEAMRPQLGEVYERRVGARAWIGVGILVFSLFCLATRMNALVELGAVVFLVGIALVAPAIVNPLAKAFSSGTDLIFAQEGALARSNLQRNPGRSATTVTAVMLGLAAIVAMLGVVTSIFGGFLGYIDKSMSADYMFIPQSIVLSTGNTAAGPRLADEVRHTAGIDAVSTLRVGFGKVAGAQVQVIGIDPATYPKVANLEWNAPSTDQAYGQIASGRWIVANGIYASQHGLTIGQPIVIDTPTGPRTYHVAAIGNDYLNAKLATIYVSQANLARDFNVSSDLLVMANRSPASDPAATLARLQAIATGFPAFKLYESATWKAEQQKTFDSTLVIFYALTAALALPSLLALINTLAVSVLARTREIGMLRAVGSTRRQVRRMVMAESLLLSAIGTAFGIVAGLWLGYALVAAMASVGWVMPYYFPWGGILATIVVGLGFGMLAALVPARNAARLNVVDALHYE